LILGEQQYFVWDAASQSTKLLDLLKVGGAMGPALDLDGGGPGVVGGPMCGYKMFK